MVNGLTGKQPRTNFTGQENTKCLTLYIYNNNILILVISDLFTDSKGVGFIYNGGKTFLHELFFS